MSRPHARQPDMSGYGVDAATWSPLQWDWARSRLEPARNYWLVTVSGDGRPHSLPVWGVWNDTDLQFSFSCAPTAHKARNIEQNPRIVVTTESTVECLSVEGIASLLHSTNDRRELWIERFVQKYRAMGSDVGAPFLRRNLLFEVTPSRAIAVIEREGEFATRPTRWDF